MRKDEFVMRGQTAYNSAKSEYEPETLNFSGFKPGYAFRLVEFSLWGSGNLGTTTVECFGTITAGKTAVSPVNPDFNEEGLIGVASSLFSSTYNNQPALMIVNDTYLITQNLILSVQDSAPGNNAVNWQCKFERVKMSKSEEAVTNYKQFLISSDQ